MAKKYFLEKALRAPKLRKNCIEMENLLHFIRKHKQKLRPSKEKYKDVEQTLKEIQRDHHQMELIERLDKMIEE